jgi:hypothetical protein
LGFCKIVDGNDVVKYPLDDKLQYADYEGYMAYLWVGKNFGCIHFKPKKEWL